MIILVFKPNFIYGGFFIFEEVNRTRLPKQFISSFNPNLLHETSSIGRETAFCSDEGFLQRNKKQNF